MANRLDFIAGPGKRLLVLLGALTLFLGAPGASAALITLDLNDFYADPTITVAADGAAALMAEDAGLSFVLLANDPFLGDPRIIVPGLGTRLLFDYVFDEAAGQDDQFRAFVFDSDTGLTPSGFEFLTSQSNSGTVGFDLGALLGRTLGMQFELAALFGDTGPGSTVALSNLRLESPDPTGVPEPGTLSLCFAAFLAWSARRRRR